jgi:hypothetical protein
VILSGCDAFIQFKVENNTDEQVTAWLLHDDCSTVVGEFGQYYYQTEIDPHRTETISDITGSQPPEPSCVQVVNSTRRLVLSEPYVYDRTYVVDDVNNPGGYVPPESELPKSLLDRYYDLPPAVIIVASWTLIAIIGFGAYMVFRRWRRRRKRESAEVR